MGRPRGGQRKYNTFVERDDGILEVDISTPTLPDVIMLIHREEWLPVKDLYGRVHAVKRQRNIYAACRDIDARKLLLVHRILRPFWAIIDHINGVGFDNRPENLREATNTQNHRNQRHNRRNCSSIYRGVHWYKRVSRWMAYIKFNEKKIHLGYFTSELEAARAYDRAAIKHFGEFANPNFEQEDAEI